MTETKNTKALTPTRARTLEIALKLISESGTGEVAQYYIRSTRGCNVTALFWLAENGYLNCREAPFVMPTGPYAGDVYKNYSYYSAP